jgi:hypothetical protein
MGMLQAPRPAGSPRSHSLRTGILLATLLGACGGADSTAPRPTISAVNSPNGKNATVRVTPKRDTLDALYDTLQLTANVPVTWTSLAPSVATIDAAGRVVAAGPGLALIEALAARKADTAEVLVRQVLASVQVTPDSITLALNGVDTLTAVASDANGFPIANAVVTWTSDATAIATVANGIVSAVDSGTTIIRAILDGLSDTAWVRVADVANPYP